MLRNWHKVGVLYAPKHPLNIIEFHSIGRAAETLNRAHKGLGDVFIHVLRQKWGIIVCGAHSVRTTRRTSQGSADDPASEDRFELLVHNCTSCHRRLKRHQQARYATSAECTKSGLVGSSQRRCLVSVHRTFSALFASISHWSINSSQKYIRCVDSQRQINAPILRKKTSSSTALTVCPLIDHNGK